MSSSFRWLDFYNIFLKVKKPPQTKHKTKKNNLAEF